MRGLTIEVMHLPTKCGEFGGIGDMGGDVEGGYSRYGGGGMEGYIGE